MTITVKKASAFVGMLALGLSAIPAMAASSFQVYEVPAGQPVFSGNGGPGSTISVTAFLTDPANHANIVGSKQEYCTIVAYNQLGEPQLFCFENLLINGKGMLYAAGLINERQLEAYKPQTIGIYAGTGAYAGKIGSETLLQVVFPAEFLLTINLN